MKSPLPLKAYSTCMSKQNRQNEAVVFLRQRPQAWHLLPRCAVGHRMNALDLLLLDSFTVACSYVYSKCPALVTPCLTQYCLGFCVPLAQIMSKNGRQEQVLEMYVAAKSNTEVIA